MASTSTAAHSMSACDNSQVAVPMLTVVIPTRNEEEHLPQLLRNLREQSFHNFDVIVADHDSIDNTRDICRRNGVVIVDGGYPARGRNCGAQHASAELILFLDADVVIDCNFIEEAIDVMRRKEADGMSFCFYPDSKRFVHRLTHWVARWAARVLTAIGLPHGIGGGLLVRRCTHIAIGGFDETVSEAEDMEYLKRLRKNGFKYELSTYPCMQISVRRIEKLGSARFWMRWVKTELRRYMFGEIRDHGFPYFQLEESKS